MQLTLTYDQSDESIKELLDFIERRQYVARTFVPPGYEEYFREQARFVSAHTSVRIEGNSLSPDQAFIVLAEGADESSPDEVETANVNDAYELMCQLAADSSVKIDVGLIRVLNSMLLRHLPGLSATRRGQYRPGPALIVDSQSREVRYRPPPPQWVAGLMDIFATSLRSWTEEYPGPVVAAMAHFGIISIHPFEDGNGRTARLVGDMILEQTQSSVDGMISVSQAILASRDRYYRVLKETQSLDFQETVDVTPFVRFHLDALRHASTRLEDRVIRFTRDLNEWKKSTEGMLNPRQATGFSFLMDMGRPLSSTTYARMTNISQSSAIADLNDLVKRGFSVKVGNGKSTRYVVEPKLAAKMKRVDDESAEAAQETIPTTAAV